MEKLLAYRCLKCGHAMYTKRSLCPKCRGKEFHEFELEEGKLVTYTALHVTSPGF